MERTEIIKQMRAENKTYYEIGEVLGISRQRVEQIAKKTRARKNSVDIEKIVYQGIYDLFQNDRKMTFRKLATIFNGKRPDKSYMLKIRRLVLGEKALIDIQAIINICNYLQKPFEVVFKRR